MEYQIEKWEKLIFGERRGQDKFIKEFLDINIKALMSVTWSSTQILVGYFSMDEEVVYESFTFSVWEDYLNNIK